eukprot:6488008-Ditylum_brightwellii.AAC.1
MGWTLLAKTKNSKAVLLYCSFDHDFASYHKTEWFQWELNVQLLAKGASQRNAANEVGNKVKALLIKLLATH